jgi:uncharacterized phiE125 gp8 family phage protein
VIPVPGALFSDVEVMAPTSEPFTADEAAEYVRQLAGVDTARLESLVVSARQFVEERTSRRLLTQTRLLTIDGFPCHRDWVPLTSAPVQSVAWVRTYNDAGDETALAPSTYWLDAPGTDPARLVFRFTPSRMREQSGLRIQFVAGYASPEDIPSPLKLAMQMLMAHWYANPTGMATGSVPRELDFSVSTLLEPYTLGDLG